MKKILIALAICNILGGIVGFFILVGGSPFLSLVSLAGGALGSVPFFALVGAMENIEILQQEQWILQEKLKRLTDESDSQTKDAALHEVRDSLPKEVSRHSWECVKCKAVNKAGTATCSSCGAGYSSWVNPISGWRKR